MKNLKYFRKNESFKTFLYFKEIFRSTNHYIPNFHYNFTKYRISMKNLSLTIIFVTLLFQSCMKGDEVNECSGICTEEFRTITIEIIDSEGNPVALDSFRVINTANGNELNLRINESEFQYLRENGTYPIFSDLFSGEFRQREITINFKGFIDEVEVVSSNYEVGADCCHVYYISGELELQIEL